MNETVKATSPPTEIDHVHGITTVDARFVFPGAAASHLVVEDGHAAFVDVGTAHSTPHLLAALEARGLAPGDVDWVLPTHVHLDHAGGTGTLLARLPNAKVVAHPRAARHLIDPSRLLASAAAVYGAETLAELYGEVRPVPEERLIEAPEGFTVELAGRPLRFLDTPGHARHHYCVWDERSRGIFSGDCFGISYRWADTERGAWILPTTTPTQLDPEAMHHTLDRLMALEPERVFLTHWGQVTEVERLSADLRNMLDAMVELARSLANAPNREERLPELLRELYVESLRSHGCTAPAGDLEELLSMDVDLNSQGLLDWLARESR